MHQYGPPGAWAIACGREPSARQWGWLWCLMCGAACRSLVGQCRDIKQRSSGGLQLWMHLGIWRGCGQPNAAALPSCHWVAGSGDTSYAHRTRCPAFGSDPICIRIPVCRRHAYDQCRSRARPARARALGALHMHGAGISECHQHMPIAHPVVKLCGGFVRFGFSYTYVFICVRKCFALPQICVQSMSETA